MIDQRSAKNIATLKPEVQPLAKQLVLKAREQGINVKVISGYRSYKEQDALYAQGRTKPGQVVTKAKGGYSRHNFGTAFDVGIFSQNGKTYYGESEAYKEVGKIGKQLGLSWGGDWQGFVDEPHFELNPLGLSIAQMRERTAKGENLFT